MTIGQWAATAAGFLAIAGIRYGNGPLLDLGVVAAFMVNVALSIRS